jgi:hypothetical protein
VLTDDDFCDINGNGLCNLNLGSNNTLSADIGWNVSNGVEANQKDNVPVVFQ